MNLQKLLTSIPDANSGEWKALLVKAVNHLLIVEGWNTATLAAGWSVAGGRTVQYYKDPSNVVHLRGALTGGTGTMFTLPEGYRPDQDAYYCCYQGGAAEVRVATTGVVTLTNAGTGGISIDAIHFRVAD